MCHEHAWAIQACSNASNRAVSKKLESSPLLAYLHRGGWGSQLKEAPMFLKNAAPPPPPRSKYLDDFLQPWGGLKWGSL